MDKEQGALEGVKGTKLGEEENHSDREKEMVEDRYSQDYKQATGSIEASQVGKEQQQPDSTSPDACTNIQQ